MPKYFAYLNARTGLHSIASRELTKPIQKRGAICSRKFILRCGEAWIPSSHAALFAPGLIAWPTMSLRRTLSRIATHLGKYIDFDGLRSP